ncbi:unnamed protein product [Didymodactylos carnosus]|uniref:BZIP domain-containing protein n=1 Tax=Didymodactylos carnosus TaxID=1234261 RepID=A0A8S2CV52_9BILA|nr:unnamed protein product [Didymodactylos carnosus]CAF3550564.1 unnamed protein product [Didymodactylos carnosus]
MSQPTAEKSVQTQENLFNPNIIINTLNNYHENTTTEVANTLVSMATVAQRPNGKQTSFTCISPQSTHALPVISLADYNCIPTASVLQANVQTKLLAKSVSVDNNRRDLIVENDVQTQETTTISNTTNNDNDECSMDDTSFDSSMSTSNYQSSSNTTNDKKTEGKDSNNNKKRSSYKMKTSLMKKNEDEEIIQYGPIAVRPRKRTAPTLANGRKSKDEFLPPDEDVRRKQRRERNKQAAAKCRRKRNDLKDILEKEERVLMEQQDGLKHSLDSLTEHKQQLESILQRHLSQCTKKLKISTPTTNNITNTNSLNHSNILTNKEIRNDEIKSHYQSQHHILTTVNQTPSTISIDNNNNNGKNSAVTINLANINPNDLFTLNSSRTVTVPATTSTNTGDVSIPMITIHIGPEFAQALLQMQQNAVSVEQKSKLTELFDTRPLAMTLTNLNCLPNNNNSTTIPTLTLAPSSTTTSAALDIQNKNTISNIKNNNND